MKESCLDRKIKIEKIRQKLKSGKISIGTWMQLHDPSIAEILGSAGYDWVTIDMEHGSYSHNELPNLFRALELGNTLPLVRLIEGNVNECKLALDAGAGGVIIPNIQNDQVLKSLISACRWPPAGSRGVGFSRANLYGKNFNKYTMEAQNPIVVAMIESWKAVENLEAILSVGGLDAILIGPYDLSASIGKTADFESVEFVSALNKIQELAKKAELPTGIHIVQPDAGALEERIKEGYQFLAYSIDSVFLNTAMQNPLGL
jgi:2-dehydro-3-deoxyglucarate aldolase